MIGVVLPWTDDEISGTQEYGETWRAIRGLMHNGLNIKAARAYVPYQDLENKVMLMGFLEDPNSFANHIKRYTNSLTTQMVFGFRTTSIHDPMIKRIFNVSECARPIPIFLPSLFAVALGEVG